MLLLRECYACMHWGPVQSWLTWPFWLCSPSSHIFFVPHLLSTIFTSTAPSVREGVTRLLAPEPFLRLYLPCIRPYKTTTDYRKIKDLTRVTSFPNIFKKFNNHIKHTYYLNLNGIKARDVIFLKESKCQHELTVLRKGLNIYVLRHQGHYSSRKKNVFKGQTVCVKISFCPWVFPKTRWLFPP